MRSNLALGSVSSVLAIGAAIALSVHCQTPDTHLMVNDGEDCGVCHQSEFQSATQPLHAGVISDDCAQCHSNLRWSPARGSNHSFALTGAHELTPCNQCHLGSPPIYEGTPTECVDCHGAERDRVTEPSHADFSNDCLSCHQLDAWQPAALDHEWPLEGAHARAGCGDCHQGDPPRYEGTPEACVDCHQSDRAPVVDPPHDGFSDDCSSCHGTASWDGADFDHERVFPLRGAHQLADCADCHQGAPAVFAGTARQCVGCHQADYDASTFAGHDAFPSTCADCHSETAWTPASGGHPENLFSTRGDHSYACNECHNPSLGPNGAGNADCVGCHEGEHTLARMDNEHDEVRDYPRGQNVAPNFCLQCHPGGRE